jgi:uncharacterized membrane protein YdfJ with MMPL/SSD domain
MSSPAAGALVVRPVLVGATMSVLGRADWWRPAGLVRIRCHVLEDHHPGILPAEAAVVPK